MQATAEIQVEVLKKGTEEDIDFDKSAPREVSSALRVILASAFTHYVRAKNFRSYMRGCHFQDRHVFLDRRGKHVLTMTDEVAEQLTVSLRSILEVCARRNDYATARLIENWIGETARRTWFPFEINETL